MWARKLSSDLNQAMSTPNLFACSVVLFLIDCVIEAKLDVLNL